MQVLKNTSLGNQVSKKISAWILIFVVTVILAIFLVSFILSRQMFNKQVNIWNTIAPQQTLTSLIDSDHFSIKREVEFLKSTGLFSTFVITDNKQTIISQFGSDIFSGSNLIPIQDNAKVVWGYYYFKSDFYRFISPFLFAVAIFLILIALAYFVIRWRIRVSLESEFSRFNDFLVEIEKVTLQLPEFYNQDAEFQIASKPTYNNEQAIINRTISRLLEEIAKANKALREAVALAEKRRFQEELTRTALQVAHDIGSPLAVLEIIQTTALALPEESRILIRNAASRIRDISNTLLKKAKHDFSSHPEGQLSQQQLYFLLSQVVSEKRMQYGSQVDIDLRVEKNAYKIFSLIKKADFSRVFSNLINNAVEALENDNKIAVSLTDFGKEALIQVQDNGKGISRDVLNRLGNVGASFGKSQGLGVGLNHAINAVKDWGGKFEIISQEKKGTTVQISLPKCSSPSWSLSEINIVNGQFVVIVDDDELIHSVWKKKFAEFQHAESVTVKLLHFYSPAELIAWKRRATVDESILYLCDYEFIGSDMTGLDLIKKLQINYLSILVTSSVVDEIIMGCESENIKLLPKNIASIIPIVTI